MNLIRLVLRNLSFHWRGNLAVMLGVAVGTSVLTGALLVGDSLRGSLRELTLARLGWVDQALVTGRLFRQELADEIRAEHTAPALMLRGTASNPENGRRVGHVTMYGVDNRFWWRESSRPESSRPVIATANLADALKPAREFIEFDLQKISPVAREWLLNQSKSEKNSNATGRERVLDQIQLDTSEISFRGDTATLFSLVPGPEHPRNVFVPLDWMQTQILRLQSNANALPEHPINAIFVGGGSPTDLNQQLREHLQLIDWGLLVLDPETRARKLDRDGDGSLRRSEWTGRVPKALAELAERQRGTLQVEQVQKYYRERGMLTVESRQQLLDAQTADVVLAAAKEMKLNAAPTLVYIANSISAGGAEVPYSIVAALDLGLAPPLGPFLPKGIDRLEENDIVLVDWIADGLQQTATAAAALVPAPFAALVPMAALAKKRSLPIWPGDPITMTYFHPEEHGTVPPTTATFRYRGSIPLRGAADDPDLTPEFAGITDTQNVRDWDPPPPFDRRDIQRHIDRRDEDYWRDYRTTPKAYINLARGQQLWGSQLGRLTSIRLAPQNPSADLHQLAGELPGHLDPEKGGWVFDAVKERSLEASGGGTDFGGLFVGFSSFLILAALMLVGMLFRLNLERRAAEAGLLLALGYRQRKLRQLYLLEGGVLALIGGLVGLVAAISYAKLLLRLLAAWWPGGVDWSFLQVHASPVSMIIGYSGAVLVSLAAIYWATRSLASAPVSTLLAGRASSEEAGGISSRRPRWSRRVAITAAILAVALLIGGAFIKDGEAKASTFFSGGALLLTAGLTAVWAWMHRDRQTMVSGHGPLAWTRLAVRNAARHPVRSLLTAGLLASAVFVVVAVQSFHQEVGSNVTARHSGSGGFELVGQSDVLIYQDLNTPEGRAELHFPPDTEQIMQGVTIYSFGRQAGDDASCLSLYQPRRPRLLGMPEGLIQQKRFEFAESEAQTPAERDNPWLLLDREYPEGQIPAVADATTAQWMLKTSLGGHIPITDGEGRTRKLRIVGLLQSSIFQSELVLSEKNLRKLYPGVQGYHFFLIEAPTDRAAAVGELLAKTLASRGFEVSTTAERLKTYLDVENTYLSTFQALGGLGLLLGALGLAVVLLRSVWERRGELALFRALGYRRSVLGWLVLAENCFLLLIGLAVGTAAALLSVLPYLLEASGAMPWWGLLGLLGLVLVLGLGAGALAVATTLRAPLLPALRKE